MTEILLKVMLQLVVCDQLLRHDIDFLVFYCLTPEEIVSYFHCFLATWGEGEEIHKRAIDKWGSFALYTTHNGVRGGDRGWKNTRSELKGIMHSLCTYISPF